MSCSCAGPRRLRLGGLFALALAVAWSPSALTAQIAPLRGHWEDHLLLSGNQPNPWPVEHVVFRAVVQLPPGIPWLRLHFTRAQLGKGSYLRIVSLQDGDLQTMNQVHLEQWQFGTAFFNGNAVTLEIVAGPDTPKNFVEMTKVYAGDLAAVPPLVDTICGSQDNRVPSSNAAVGRLLSSGLGGGCTGWIIDQPPAGNDRCHLAAGHCFPGSAILQFNVPASNANCALVMPPAASQYAVDSGTMVFVNGGIGNDYAVFRCFPNSVTNLTTYQAQAAAFTLSTVAPAASATVRVTGFGTDGSNTNNAGGANGNCTCVSANGTGHREQVQQTGTGPMVGTAGNAARYEVDTCGGNSGSPVIDEATGRAFAIHTNGGCDTSAGSYNSGTLVGASAVQAAIVAVCGSADNDECTSAFPVVDGVNGPYTNVGATTSSPPWSCSGSGSDVWFSYVATCNGPVTFDTCGASTNFDTVLELLAGACGNQTVLGCNDDFCGLQSSVTAPLVVGVTYYVRVRGYNNATGAFALNVTGCNAADECAGAIPVQIGLNGPFSNNLATASAPTWPCGVGTMNDIWLSYYVPCPADVLVTTCTPLSGFDTVLQVFQGSCGLMASRGCNDDSSEPGCQLAGQNRFSRLVVNVAIPTTLLIRVGGYNGARGSFGLEVQLAPANETCATAIAVGDFHNGPFGNFGAASDPMPLRCAPLGSDVWFAYTASCTGVLTVDTCSATRTFDTVLEAYAGTCTGLLAFLGCSDDACSLGSVLTFPVTQGTTYFLRVGGYYGAQGLFDLDIACRPPNNECQGAIAVVRGQNGPFTNVNATLSVPPWLCGMNVGSDVWFAYVATCTAPVTFSTCTATRDFDTVMQAWTGSCSALALQACNDDSCGVGSLVTVNLAQGQTCWLSVGGYQGATGVFDILVQGGTGAGSFTTVLPGCGAATLTATGDPNIGGSVTFTLNNVQGLGFLIMGFMPDNTQVCPGCTVGVGPGNLALFTRLHSLAVPCSPIHIGTELRVQGADLLAPNGCTSPLPFTLTETIRVRIG